MVAKIAWPGAYFTLLFTVMSKFLVCSTDEVFYLADFLFLLLRQIETAWYRGEDLTATWPELVKLAVSVEETVLLFSVDQVEAISSSRTRCSLASQRRKRLKVNASPVHTMIIAAKEARPAIV